MIGWVLFRSPDIGAAIEYVAAMFTLGGVSPGEVAAAVDTKAFLAIVIGATSVLVPGNIVGGLLVTGRRGLGGVALRLAEVGMAFPFALVIVASGSFSPFLYYQF
jgi:alginate O-acetyltransferase complex protein AlgI